MNLRIQLELIYWATTLPVVITLLTCRTYIPSPLTEPIVVLATRFRYNNAIIRPAITYGAAIWHTPTPIKGPKSTKPVGPAVKLAKIQNKCLRAIVGVYKATPTLVLKTETSIPPLDLYLNKRLANFRFRHKEKLVTEACV